VKVKDIGQLDSDSKEVLERYFKKVFNDETGVSKPPKQSLKESTASVRSSATSEPFAEPPKADRVATAYESLLPFPDLEERGRTGVLKEISMRSRSSCASSVLSVAFSGISKSSASSRQSLGIETDTPNRLVRIIWPDAQLQSLFKESPTKVSLERFEENFRKCLVQFSVHLRMEAESPTSDKQMILVSRVVRNFSRVTARMIRECLEADIETDCDTSALNANNSKHEDSDT
jgi:hypothetical protein